MLGYNMMPGIHFNNSYSPVGTDLSVRTLLGILLYIMNMERNLVKRDVSNFTVTKERKEANNDERFNQYILNLFSMINLDDAIIYVEVRI